jgi:hypothetical protein
VGRACSAAHDYLQLILATYMKNIIPSLAYFVRKLELINPSMKNELAEITTGLISINTFPKFC